MVLGFGGALIETTSIINWNAIATEFIFCLEPSFDSKPSNKSMSRDVSFIPHNGGPINMGSLHSHLISSGINAKATGLIGGPNDLVLTTSRARERVIFNVHNSPRVRRRLLPNPIVNDLFNFCIFGETWIINNTIAISFNKRALRVPIVKP